MVRLSKNLMGQRFSMLTVISDLIVEDKKLFYICRCNCGNVVKANRNSLINGNVKSCGCLRYRNSALLGQRFGKLTVLKNVGKLCNEFQMYRCKCDCGNEVLVTMRNLVNNEIKNCGCSRIHNNIIGLKFGDMLVMESADEKTKSGSKIYKCLCKCGKIEKLPMKSLRKLNGSKCNHINAASKLKIHGHMMDSLHYYNADA